MSTEGGSVEAREAGKLKSPEKEKLTNAEARTLLARFTVMDFLNLAAHAAAASSEQMSMTLISEFPGTKVTQRVTHPRKKKA
jgi:hypothetical protein